MGPFVVFFLIFTTVATSSQWIKIENYNIKKTNDGSKCSIIVRESELIRRNNICSSKITFHIALKQNEIGVRQLENYILNSASNIDSEYYGQYLSISAISDLVSPPKREADLVLQWLNRITFSIARISVIP